MIKKEPVSPSQKRQAQNRLEHLIQNTNHDFKIGRVTSSGFGFLRDAHRYKGFSDGPYPLFVGGKGEAACMEKHLIGYGWERYGTRCLNEKSGGGGQGEDDTHIVYVFFKMNKEEKDLGRLYGGLKKAWCAFKIAKAQGDRRQMLKYANAINQFESQLCKSPTMFQF